MIKDVKLGEIDTNVLYVSSGELSEELGVHINSVRNAAKSDYIDAFRFNRKLFFHPNEVKKYKTYISCGILKGTIRND